MKKIIELSIQNRTLVAILGAILVGLGIWGMLNVRLDAIPDLSDVQVIVITDYPGQAPEVVEDQVTYPLTTAMLSVPGSKVVRAFSMFETSMVYIIFEDGVDLYWARARVLEYLNFARDRLPPGVEPKLGPDATSLGWIYQYVLLAGHYCPRHPQGIWRDAGEGRWYASPDEAPAERREGLERVKVFDAPGECPLDGEALLPANQDLAQLRSLQDWYLRYELTALEGVSEVAAIGGFVKEYQVLFEPERLQAFRLPLRDVAMAIERSNNDVGGSVLEMAENEYMVRSRGYLRGLEDLGKVVVGRGEGGIPIHLEEVARLEVGGQARRGIGEWNGQGEAVGGVVISRYGENALKVIREVKEKLGELEPGLPPGVAIKTSYDRSALIHRSIETLRVTLLEEILVVGLMCILFLLHARSELVAMFVVPAGVLVSLLVMHLLGLNANIMSLGGIAIAIGVMVDSSVVMVENAHKHLDREAERAREGHAPRPRSLVILEAAQEVGPSLFFSLLVITVSFLPVFALGEQSGRLFRPLAYTKTFAIAAGSLLAVTIVPVLMVYFITDRVLPREWGWRRNLSVTLSAMVLPAAGLALLPLAFPGLGPYRWWIAGGWLLLAGMLLLPQRIIHEERNPLSRILQRLYHPAFVFALSHRRLTLLLALAALASAVWPFLELGSEFMPPLDEGDLLYMPTTTLSSISVSKSREVLQQTDKLIATFPEVLSVHGKIGRADTATDPAPLNMIETVVQLRNDPGKWRRRKVSRFFSGWPDWLKRPFTATFWPEERAITTEELVSGWQDPDGTMHQGLDDVVRLPGLRNAWPYPIENRINMLATGIKTPVGIKITGPDLEVLSELAERASSLAGAIDGARSYTEPILTGYYLDIEVKREEIARYGLTVGDVQDVVRTAIGGATITTTVEGLERYPVTIRYKRELRDSVPALENVLVAAPGGAQIPLGQLASFQVHPGPTMVRSENSRPVALVFVDIAGRDLGGFVAEARRTLARNLTLPPGYTLSWSGQFEFIQAANRRLMVVVPITLALIVVLLYLSTRSWFRVMVIMLAVPFSLVGAVWLLWLLDYNLSLAVWVGMIALAGLDAETGAVMLLYLDSSFERYRSQGRLRSPSELWEAVHDGAVKRIRPKFITVATDFIGLSPLLWASGTGSDVMRRLAAPMLGGLFSSFLMELLVYPVIFYTWKSWTLRSTWRTSHENDA